MVYGSKPFQVIWGSPLNPQIMRLLDLEVEAEGDLRTRPERGTLVLGVST